MFVNKRILDFCKIKNFAYGEIIESNFSNPHPGFRSIVPM